MRAFVSFLLFVQSPEGLLGVSLADSPDSPVIGHASGGPVLVKEGKGFRAGWTLLQLGKPHMHSGIV